MRKQVNEGLEYFWLFVGIALLVLLFEGDPDIADGIKKIVLDYADLHAAVPPSTGANP